MNYIVTKPVKNKGIAALLVIFFGGLGLFYSSILGGFIMGIIAPILIVLFLFFGFASGSMSIVAIVIIFCCLYYFICLIWAIRAVDNYNQEIIAYSMATPHITPNNNYQNIVQTSTDISDKLSEQKGELYKDLERIKNLHDQNIISEEDYNTQKGFLLKKIETQSYNQKVSNTPSNYNEVYSEYPTQEKKKRTTLWIWILSILLILTLLYLMYDGKSNSFKLSKITGIFHSHSKDKEYIKNQIEKTYFGIMSGAYTAQNMPGIGPEGLPFYNQNMESVIAMGLVPFAQLLGGYKIEAKNIEVYNFQDENTAQVRYDLIASNTDPIHIDMVVKKIGGYWKLDAEKAFGQKKVISNPAKKINLSTSLNNLTTDNSDLRITKKDFNKLTEQDCFQLFSTTDKAGIDTYYENRYLIFFKEEIWTIENGAIIKKYKVVDVKFDDEDQIQITDKGDKFIYLGGPTGFEDKKGKYVQLNTENIAPSKIFIKEEFFK